MKLALLILAVVIGVLLWRARSTVKHGAHTAHRAQTGSPTDEMVICAHCAVHIPKSEALEGHHGSYCSIEHRRVAES